MNIDKFGRINNTKHKTNYTYEIENLRKTIILLKSEIVVVTKRLDNIFEIVERERMKTLETNRMLKIA